MQRKLFIEYLNNRLQAFLAEKSKNDFFKEHFPKIYSELGKKEQAVYDHLEQKFNELNAEVENLLAKVSKAYQIQDSKHFDKEIKEAMILAFTKKVCKKAHGFNRGMNCQPIKLKSCNYLYIDNVGRKLLMVK